jgi:hypothetical protein
MKTLLGIFVSLVSTFLLCNGQNGNAGWVFNVAQAMVRRFSKDEERTKDLTAADELVRGLTFDMFDEQISCRVGRGILLTDYRTVIENVARRFSIPDDIKDSLFDGEYHENMAEIVQNFKFEKGKKGNFVYGRVATIKHGDKIDMAYSIYTLDFKLSPTVIEHRKKTNFLWFTTGEKVWHETKERNMSSKEKDNLQEHLMIKAISKFRAEYAGLIGSSRYCDTLGNCDYSVAEKAHTDDADDSGNFPAPSQAGGQGGLEPPQ